jgi:hypothetical protein
MVANDQTAPPIAVTVRPGSASYTVAGLFLVAVAAVLMIMTLSAASVDDEIWWGAIALAVYCAGLLPLMTVAAQQDGLGLASWRIGPWSLVWGVLAFGLATISWLGPQTSSSSAEILPGSIVRALGMIAVALTMLTVGYCTGPYRLAVARTGRVADALSRRFTDEIRGPAVPWILVGVGIVAELGLAGLTGHLGYVGDVSTSVTTASGYSQYLAIAGQCVPLGVLAAAIRAYRSRTLGTWLSLGVLFTVAIALGALAGAKASFVVAILAVIIPGSVVRRRLPAGAIVAAVLAFLLVIIPFNLAYRASARGAVTLSTGQAVAAAPSIADQVVASDLSSAVLGQSARFLADRIRAVDTPAIVMQRTPSEIPFASPAQLLVSPVVGLIPRALWPGKPILTPGYQISQEYFQLPPQVYTSSDVTPEADLYRHGGWFPLIAGMFLLGCGIRILDEVTDLRRGLHGAFLIVLLFPDIVQAGTDCASLLAGIPGIILLWLAVVSLSFSRRPALAPQPSRRPSALAARS